jgi:hypothetical protein
MRVLRGVLLGIWDILARDNTLKIEKFVLFRANVAQPGRATDL